MTIFESGKVSLSINGVAFLIFSVLAIATVGYLLGKVTIKGVKLGTAGVFLVALLFGCLFYGSLDKQLMIGEISYITNALKVVENLGLMLFVTSVGFIAGPKFFYNLKKNFRTYILLGLIIIISGALICCLSVVIAKATMDVPEDELTAIMTGLFSGALTSTSAFSAAKEAVGTDYESFVAVGNGIAYIFGVIGVVLFVQIIPKLLKADMAVERAKFIGDGNAEDPVDTSSAKKLINIDSFGVAPMVISAIIGLLAGNIKIGAFSLTTTGGYLLIALVLGHFGKIGRINLMPPAATLKVFREFGLMLFLIGAGIAGGAKFIECFQPVYFLYGAFMTILPMVISFLVAKYILKLNLLDNLGALTGGMTSTPALGTLINISGTEDVAAPYAATYPIALISVVLASQFIIMIF